MDRKSKRRAVFGAVSSIAFVAGTYGAATAASAWTGSTPSNGATGSGLHALASIDASQAASGAVGAVPGTAGPAELIFDDGFVVYRVIVTGSDGTRTEVIVDAGNGSVLTSYAPNWSGVIGDSSAGDDSDALSSATSAATATATATATAATTPSTSSSGFTGSVLSNGATGASLRALASITGDQAASDAVAAVPGTAGPSELIFDDGFVVYRVIVTASDGTRTEVIVDAGNGNVLAQYAPNWSGVVGDSSAGSDVGAIAG